MESVKELVPIPTYCLPVVCLTFWVWFPLLKNGDYNTSLNYSTMRATAAAINEEKNGDLI